MKIILGVTGSIASYKSYDLARLLIKKGWEVKVVLSKGALEFLKPETFRYLGIQDVYLPQDDFNLKKLNSDQNVLHIELAKWADKIVIAPLSANSLSRIALGLCDDLMVSILLASGAKPILLFPAMNTQMWLNKRIQDHVGKLILQENITIIPPDSGELVCGDTGVGKFPEINTIASLIETLNPLAIKNKKVLITAGATASPIDPVRYVTNPSSGKMGLEVAKSFLSEGYKVTVLAGHNCTKEIEELLPHPYFTLIPTATTERMKKAALEIFPDSDLYISTGAIADIEFDTSSTKLKKEQMGNQLKFRQAADILKEILSLKKSHQKVVSFAAETETTDEVFLEKMRRKPVDLMIGNKVANGLIEDESILGFQKNDGEYYFITSTSIQGPYPLKKKQIGEKLVQWFQEKKSW
jgi:phosphopantothenoylcysteine decarboxylase/phosphopantothenate--cysteine ligase